MSCNFYTSLLNIPLTFIIYVSIAFWSEIRMSHDPSWLAVVGGMNIVYPVNILVVNYQ